MPCSSRSGAGYRVRPYCSGGRPDVSQAASTAPEVSRRITPDSSEQKLFCPDCPIATGTAEVLKLVLGLAVVPAPPAAKDTKVYPLLVPPPRLLSIRQATACVAAAQPAAGVDKLPKVPYPTPYVAE